MKPAHPRARCGPLPLALASLALLGCTSPEGPDADRLGALTGEPGFPLAGLDEGRLARFHSGEALFNRVFGPDEGLGPLFNENQCSACHTDPASGGTGEQLVLKATRHSESGGCDLLAAEGGENVRSQATPLLAAMGVTRQPVPPSATGTGRFTVPFVFGLGLVEAIPDATILVRADPDDADGDGISGRAGRSADGRLGRFGRKAEAPTLVDFTDSALRLEMGLTTELEPSEGRAGGVGVPPEADPAADPEVSRADVELISDYMRFLAPVGPALPVDEAAREEASLGEELFDSLGCASCHVPSMESGPHVVAALANQVVPLYSDLLLHDMGPELADVCGVAASPSEVRTELLVGLRFRERYLHDGRTRNLIDAILGHGGEAEASRDRFEDLDRVSQELVVRFLNTL